MVHADDANSPRLAALCKRLGRLCSPHDLERDDGLNAAKFKLHTNKQRILDGGPWVFSGRLVVFKAWIPNTPLHCYDFSTCAIWVQVFGLPLEWCTEQLIRKAVMTVGKVLEVRADGQDTFTMRLGRARVELDFQHPLQIGRLIRINNKTIWLDFRYERLAHYCYLCGKLGHYATSCTASPVDVDQLTGDDKLPYGH
ncbi:hypothetical protein EUGRSUZ_A01526 [Eucalyptus grandis]|uniref:Uncharacterized protein n=2 Tax=Eucalyptus grandis TaxID=71139 RepID=A0ACC3M359_EUCGR|nr:hypothetical protein EUGRSUZ_A01526 [Eucalyptus grandis]